LFILPQDMFAGKTVWIIVEHISTVNRINLNLNLYYLPLYSYRS